MFPGNYLRLPCHDSSAEWMVGPGQVWFAGERTGRRRAAVRDCGISEKRGSEALFLNDHMDGTEALRHFSEWTLLASPP